MPQPAVKPTRAAAPTAAVPDFGLVHAPSSPLVDVKRSCLRIAASDATVLLTGETGTGKEVFARMLHAASPRSARQFVPVNCGAIPETLLESELFGYVRGAFTGAVSSRRGRIALAEGGTLFLDEIGELPLALQVKLLRLLQEKTYEPVGSSESVSANFRLIAATNRDLLEEVKGGRFRRDLYYRLHVCPVRLPPLRERRSDVAHLFTYFWRRRGEARAVAPEVIQCLEAYAWPGNVRELENLVERISVCAEGDVVEMADLPPLLRGEIDDEMGMPGFGPGDTLPEGTPVPIAIAPPPLPRPVPPSLPSAIPFAGGSDDAAPVIAVDEETETTQEIVESDSMLTPTPVPLVPPTPISVDTLALPVDLPRLLRDLENAYINKALASSGGNKKEAAKLLGMGRTTLVEKLRRRNADASGP